MRRNDLYGTTILAGLALLAGPAFGQSRPQLPAQSQQNPPSAQEERSVELEEVVVTGTRIRNPEFVTAVPITVLTADGAELRGVPNVAEAILGSTAAAGSFQLNDVQIASGTSPVAGNAPGGGGVKAVGLRGAGFQRTLTLLNGRRAGPAGTRGQVQAFDLGVIPGSIVDRSESCATGHPPFTALTPWLGW